MEKATGKQCELFRKTIGGKNFITPQKEGYYYTGGYSQTDHKMRPAFICELSYDYHPFIGLYPVGVTVITADGQKTDFNKCFPMEKSKDFSQALEYIESLGGAK